jgi:hypothetical protein
MAMQLLMELQKYIKHQGVTIRKLNDCLIAF